MVLAAGPFSSIARHILGKFSRMDSLIATEMDKIQKTALASSSLAQALAQQLTQLEKECTEKQKKCLLQENEQLRGKLQQLSKQLVALQVQQGDKQFYDFSAKSPPAPSPAPSTAAPPPAVVTPAAEPSPPEQPKQPKTEKKAKKEKAPKKEAKKEVEEAAVDVGRLDFRVGKILHAEKHPDAESLYVEQIDCGEASPRTVVSGLVRFVPLEAMQGRSVVLLCNLKPAKMRGVLSQAMVMCASSPDKVEILTPPPGSLPGDLVSFPGFPRLPDPLLNPKKKVFEACAPDLKTDAARVCVYRDAAMTVEGKGVVTAESLAGVAVK